MEKSFSSLSEVQAEIQLLKVKKFQQEELIKEQLSSPSAIFSAVIPNPAAYEFRSSPKNNARVMDANRKVSSMATTTTAPVIMAETSTVSLSIKLNCSPHYLI